MKIVGHSDVGHIDVGGTCRRGSVALGGGMCEGGRHGEFQETMGNLEHAY